jgi:hypothetical protein
LESTKPEPLTPDTVAEAPQQGKQFEADTITSSEAIDIAPPENTVPMQTEFIV